MSTCWICLRQLAFRFSFDQAHTVMQAALGHQLFNCVNTARQEIVQLILACLNKVRDYDYVLLTRQVLPLVSTLKFQGDFGSVIDLLAAISKRSLDAKAVIAGELFPQGQKLSDLTLLKHLADFGKPPEIEFRRKVIENVTNFIGDQVWVGDGEPPIPRLCSFGTMDGSRNGLQTRVALSGGAQELNLIAGFGEALNAETLDPLIAPVLRTLQHRFNTTENRLLLIQFLFEIRAQLSNAQAETICTALLPFASGHCTERSPFDSHEESTVSRFNIRGTPSLARE
jgi:hypothetical protein